MIPIILASDENYFVPLYVTLKSLFSNTKENIHIKILIDKAFSIEKTELLTRLASQYDNIVEFYDMSYVNNRLKTTIPHITIATYYRLWATEVFKEYNKCIYLDVDIVVTGDIKNLYEINIGDNYIAGVKATLFHLHKNGYKSHCAMLGIKDINQYINAGVMVMNLEQIRNNKIDILFHTLISKQFTVQDQDIINASCYNHIRLLHPKFNLMITQDIGREEMYKVFGNQQTDEAFSTPIIIHYAGRVKPWKSPLVKFSEEWWRVAMTFENWQAVWMTMCKNIEFEFMQCKKSAEYKIGSIFTILPKRICSIMNAVKYLGIQGLIYKLREKI